MLLVIFAYTYHQESKAGCLLQLARAARRMRAVEALGVVLSLLNERQRVATQCLLAQSLELDRVRLPGICVQTRETLGKSAR